MWRTVEVQMILNDYQDMALLTADYNNEKDKFICGVLGLSGEASEVAEKVKKAIRKYGYDEFFIDTEELAHELGDVLWYVSLLADCLDYKLSDIAKMNLDKLYDRKKRGVIKGEGDKR
jgi:NTP pyrophosphatase (non-canonical NTP hydrolase)